MHFIRETSMRFVRISSEILPPVASVERIMESVCGMSMCE